MRHSWYYKIKTLDDISSPSYSPPSPSDHTQAVFLRLRVEYIAATAVKLVLAPIRLCMISDQLHGAFVRYITMADYFMLSQFMALPTPHLPGNTNVVPLVLDEKLQ